jgi:hypothetical protein
MSLSAQDYMLLSEIRKDTESIAKSLKVLASPPPPPEGSKHQHLTKEQLQQIVRNIWLGMGLEPGPKSLRQQLLEAFCEAARGTTSGASVDKIIDTLLLLFDIKPKQ